jgi:hypothetical protein
MKAIRVFLAPGVLSAFAANASAAPQSFSGTAKGALTGFPAGRAGNTAPFI